MTNDEWWVSLGRERCRRQRHGEGDEKVRGGRGRLVVLVVVGGGWWELNSTARLGGKLCSS